MNCDVPTCSLVFLPNFCPSKVPQGDRPTPRFGPDPPQSWASTAEVWGAALLPGPPFSLVGGQKQIQVTKSSVGYGNVHEDGLRLGTSIWPVRVGRSAFRLVELLGDGWRAVDAKDFSTQHGELKNGTGQATPVLYES